MNGYIAILNGNRIEVHADTSYQAQTKAQLIFQKTSRKIIKGHQITIVLAEKNGEQVVHSTGGV